MNGEPRDYDDEELIELLADGRATYQQVAERLGIEARAVARIARGSERPELQEQIERASVEMFRQSYRLARAYARGLVSTQISEAMKKDAKPEDIPVMRKAREFLLDRLLPKSPSGDLWGGPAPLPPPEAPAPPAPELPGLSAEDLEWIAQRHDGPEAGEGTEELRN